MRQNLDQLRASQRTPVQYSDHRHALQALTRNRRRTLRNSTLLPEAVVAVRGEYFGFSGSSTGAAASVIGTMTSSAVRAGPSLGTMVRPAFGILLHCCYIPRFASLKGRRRSDASSDTGNKQAPATTGHRFAMYTRSIREAQDHIPSSIGAPFRGFQMR